MGSTFFSYSLMLRLASFPTLAPSIKSMSFRKILILTICSTDGISSMQNSWNFEGLGFVLLIRKILNNVDVSYSGLAFPSTWRGSALKRQRLSLYGFMVFCS